MGIIRDITQKAKKHLDSDEIMLFIGARQAGKTTILHQLDYEVKSRGVVSHFLNLEDPDILSLLNASPKNLFQIVHIDLRKRSVIFLDEVQYLHNPSNFLKYFYDEYRGKIKLIVSGSSAFYLDQKFHDSLAGRKKIFPVRTLSFREFLRFVGEEELSAIDMKRLKLTEKEKIVSRYFEFMIFGGYPRVVLAPFEERKELLQEIAYSYIKKDIHESRIQQDEIFYRLFKILASQVGQLVNVSELSHLLGISAVGIRHYLAVMQKSFHIHLLRPLYRNVRKELSKMPKVYFFDLGLRNFFAGNFEPWVGRMDQGQLLENAVFRQLMDYGDLEELRFWRTIQGHELDFVVEEKEGFEVKVSAERFRRKDYRAFLEFYPSARLNVVSFSGHPSLPSEFPVFAPYELS